MLLKSLLRHPVRIAGRALWLGAELSRAALAYSATVAFQRRETVRAARARWLQRTSQRLLRVLNITINASGPVPARGLLVCNHLSYLDILVLAASVPAMFVAKREVKHWPVFGWFARLAGTVFVSREQRSDVARSMAEITAALNDGALVVLFPEGTSSSGDCVLPFKSALLEPAAQAVPALAAACLGYSLADGSVADEVCYWRDMTLVPHLLNLLGKRGIAARVAFTQIQKGCTGRKELARQLHLEVVRLQNAFVGETLVRSSAFRGSPAPEPRDGGTPTPTPAVRSSLGSEACGTAFRSRA